MRIAAGVEYCGARYSGWQKQQHAPSVQESVERALAEVANHPVAANCAGRTDAGVHALNQVAHFETEAQRDDHAWVFGANSHLPADISLTWAKPVPPDFHARYSAASRIYRYLILNRPARPGLTCRLVTWEPRPLDLERMSQAAASLLGEHDFTSYRAKSCQAKNPVRKVSRLTLSRAGDWIEMVIEANAFLQHMVRNIAGVLMAIGMGKQALGWEAEVLAARDRERGGATAPAAGLYLAGVNYPSAYAIPAGVAPVFPWPGQGELSAESLGK